jgi:hypothetical protein
MRTITHDIQQSNHDQGKWAMREMELGDHFNPYGIKNTGATSVIFCSRCGCPVPDTREGRYGHAERLHGGRL